MSNVDYRKIYERQYGPIPKDQDGRTYEVHHIDGDRENNELLNLIAVTIQEHYDIHYSQGDWAACHRMSERMKLIPEEISELSKKSNAERVINGTHPFQTRSDGTSLASDRVHNGTHHLLGGKIQHETNQRRVDNGTHHLLGENNPSHQRVHNGTHHLLGPESNRKRIESGEHNLLGSDQNRKMLEAGTHPSQQKKHCEYCNKYFSVGNISRHVEKCKEKT